MPPDQSANESARRAAQEAEAERQRLVAEQRAARESSVMLQLATNPTSGSPFAAPAATMPESRPSAQVAEAPGPNGQQRKNAMVGRANDGADVNPPRSEERRGGKEGVRTVRSGGFPTN